MPSGPHPRLGRVVLNPTYYGLVSDLPAIVTLAHDYDMAVLVDEAHGAHFCSSPLLPWSAMEAGADLAALSIHKVLWFPYPELAGGSTGGADRSRLFKNCV